MPTDNETRIIAITLFKAIAFVTLIGSCVAMELGHGSVEAARAMEGLAAGLIPQVIRKGW